MLAVRTGLSQSTISRIWRAFGLKPHRTESFQLSTDPLLIDKVRDIVGLYLDPPHHALVLCVDDVIVQHAVRQRGSIRGSFDAFDITCHMDRICWTELRGCQFCNPRPEFF
jgi:hypothetical protein